MDLYSGYINKLIDELAGLPGIGSKSAQRLAFHIINMPKAKVEKLARTMTEAKEHVRYCEECYTLTDSEKCPICANDHRDHSVIMVVENTRERSDHRHQLQPGGGNNCHVYREADQTNRSQGDKNCQRRSGRR